MLRNLLVRSTSRLFVARLQFALIRVSVRTLAEQRDLPEGQVLNVVLTAVKVIIVVLVLLFIAR